jgi:cytochrome P450
MSDVAAAVEMIRLGRLTKRSPMKVAQQRTEGHPQLAAVVERALFLQDSERHRYLRSIADRSHVGLRDTKAAVTAALHAELDELPRNQVLAAEIVGLQAARRATCALLGVPWDVAFADRLSGLADGVNRLTSSGGEVTLEDEVNASFAWSEANRVLGLALRRSSLAHVLRDVDDLSSADRLGLFLFVGATAIETISTTVIAALATSPVRPSPKELFRFFSTAPLLPYTTHDGDPMLLNLGDAFPFGVGRHHCFGAAISISIAESIVDWVEGRGVGVTCELTWDISRLGRKLSGLMVLASPAASS